MTAIEIGLKVLDVSRFIKDLGIPQSLRSKQLLESISTVDPSVDHADHLPFFKLQCWWNINYLVESRSQPIIHWLANFFVQTLNLFLHKSELLRLFFFAHRSIFSVSILSPSNLEWQVGKKKTAQKLGASSRSYVLIA